MDDLDDAVATAEARLVGGPWSEEAADAVRTARVERAKVRGQQYAEVIDLGVRWSTGAPIPHLVSNGSRAILICFVEDDDPEWDGTNPTAVSAASPTELNFAILDFPRCAAVRFGGPGDEASPNHPLYQAGLSYYDAHEVHNSEWLKEQMAMNAKRRAHVDAKSRALRHYFLVFHDETFEALAETVTVRHQRGTMSGLLTSAAQAVVSH
jgi:hypothetical protein